MRSHSNKEHEATRGTRDTRTGREFMRVSNDTELVASRVIDAAIAELRLVHRRAGGFELGLLINFNVTRLLEGVRRVIDTPSIL